MGAVLGTINGLVYYGIVIAIIAAVLYFVIKSAIKNGINESKLFRQDKDDYNPTIAAEGRLSSRK